MQHGGDFISHRFYLFILRRIFQGPPAYQIRGFAQKRGRRSSSGRSVEISIPPGGYGWCPSVVELLVSVLGHGLGIVTVFAKRLPVLPVPEQSLISTVWRDMIHNSCPRVSALLHTADTQRVALKEPL